MRDQIELFDNNKQKKWVDDEDNMILNQDLLLEGILPKGRNINGCQRRIIDLIAEMEKNLDNANRCKKILSLLANKNKTLKIKENKK